MVRMWRGWPRWRFVKIKHRLFALFAFFAAFLGLSAAAMLQYVYRVYDAHLYEESARSLNISLRTVDMELKQIERLSFNILSEPQVQELLEQLKSETNDYGRFRLHESLKNRLLGFADMNRYVLSIHFVDLVGQETVVGTAPAYMLTSRKERLLRLASERQGAFVWVPPDEDEPALVLVRDVRSWSFQRLELTRLGTLMIRVRLDKLLGDLSDPRDSRMLIADDDRVVYTPDNALASLVEGVPNGAERGYDIVSRSGDTYFRTYVRSPYTGWTYVHAIPYGNVFRAVVVMKRTAFAVLSALLLIVCLLGLRFVRSVTRPIERLARRMRLVGMGNFEVDGWDDEPSTVDELGSLHRTFRSMVEKINELIRENYVRQLAIREAEYKALQAQINPHFLYNTLDSINWLAKMNQQPQISAMVESLGALLRNAVNPKTHLITVEEECRIAEHYALIQKIRFGDRLEIDFNVADDVRGCLVPKLVLQPLMENAVHYALDRMLETCRIRVSAVAAGDDVVLTVEDNGPGIDPEWLRAWKNGEIPAQRTGIGLKNIDERIKITFGEAYGVELDSEPGRGTRVSIRIPRKEAAGHVQGAAGG